VKTLKTPQKSALQSVNFRVPKTVYQKQAASFGRANKTKKTKFLRKDSLSINQR
jgi:hypothetical protein